MVLPFCDTCLSDLMVLQGGLVAKPPSLSNFLGYIAYVPCRMVLSGITVAVDNTQFQMKIRLRFDFSHIFVKFDTHNDGNFCFTRINS